MQERFSYKVIAGPSWDVYDDNVDVEVTLNNGERYGATFFTISNIKTLFEKNRLTGECASGLYLWACQMILVDTLEPDTIQRTIETLIEDGEFASAFSRLG